jgi:hypothetical protein
LVVDTIFSRSDCNSLLNNLKAHYGANNATPAQSVLSVRVEAIWVRISATGT